MCYILNFITRANVIFWFSKQEMILWICLHLVRKLFEKIYFRPIFYVNINIKGQLLMFEKIKNVTEATFNLLFDLVMAQNIFRSSY